MHIIRRFILLLIFSTITIDLLACLSASQNRLFPLGQTSKGLCVVEVHMYRTEYRDKDEKMPVFIPAWVGISYFNIYDKDYRIVYSEFLDSIKLFKEQYYDSILTVSFKKGLHIAEKHSDFIAAEPVSISFCDYRQECSKASLLFDTINNKISIRLANRTEHFIKPIYDTTSIASDLLYYYWYYGANEDLNVLASFFRNNLFINSIREFQIGTNKITVVHIGRGQFQESADGEIYPPGKEYQAKFPFDTINGSVFEEPVLHHGHGFDFYIIE